MKKNTKNVIGEGRGFERIRRITGYLTGTIDGWNNAKRAEEKDRVKHPIGLLELSETISAASRQPEFLRYGASLHTILNCRNQRR